MNRLTVHTAVPYEVFVGGGAIGELGPRFQALFPGARAFVAADENALALHGTAVLASLRGAGVTAFSYALPAGEAHKNHETLLKLYAAMAERALTRLDALVALGGGVTGDVAGFAAATYMRGIPCAMVPTTLLSMADSSIGGKTAVNLPYGKNLVGAFSQPRLVLCDTDFIKTLPPREYRAGFAEVIKCAAIADEEAFSRLERGDMSDDEAVFMALTVKRALVESDERDMGQRRLLNFGHTVGHAVENAAGYALLHGEAVAIGMAAMAKIGERLGVTEGGTAQRLSALLQKYGLPVEYGGDRQRVYESLAYDKKTEGAEVDAVLLQKIGKAVRRRLPRKEIVL
ncbi:MAG: 3-dehydroquinate synthase [Clostridiaceae bacterium]|nr:3-dehydroquinate synthase [Eubacteriales bacterium]